MIIQGTYILLYTHLLQHGLRLADLAGDAAILRAAQRAGEDWRPVDLQPSQVRDVGQLGAGGGQQGKLEVGVAAACRERMGQLNSKGSSNAGGW